jgi:hypothetical protein
MSNAIAEEKPQDYYFQVNADESDVDYSVYICIVEKTFYDENQCLNDQTPQIAHILPSDFEELGDSVWGSERPVESVFEDLKERGFEAKALHF